MNMGRNCKLCLTPNRVEYEELRIKKQLPYREIIQFAKNNHQEYFTFASISRHFTNHVEFYDKNRIQSDKLRLQYVKEQMDSTIKAAKSIREQMEVLDKQMESLAAKSNDPEARKEAREIMHSTKELVELMFKFEDKFKNEDKDTKEMYDKIMEILKDFPPEYIDKFVSRWSEVFSS